MKAETALALGRLNREFYARNSASFSRTRNRPWPGWEHVVQATGVPATALDLACGNLRFQRFLDESFPKARIRHFCADDCKALLPPAGRVSFQKLDIVGELVTGKAPFEDVLQAPCCDLCTSFGFMHHIPTQAARMNLARALVAKANEAGSIALSFWRFADDERQAAKARGATERALQSLDLELDSGDYLLGWNGLPDEFRYCHSFADCEVEEIIESASPHASLIARFRSDGPRNSANDYIVLKRR